MVELPEDDDGYGLFRTVTPHTPTAPAASTARKATPGPTKGKPKKRAASSTGSAAHKQAHGSSMALDLPDVTTLLCFKTLNFVCKSSKGTRWSV